MPTDYEALTRALRPIPEKCQVLEKANASTEAQMQECIPLIKNFGLKDLEDLKLFLQPPYRATKEACERAEAMITKLSRKDMFLAWKPLERTFKFYPERLLFTKAEVDYIVSRVADLSKVSPFDKFCTEPDERCLSKTINRKTVKSPAGFATLKQQVDLLRRAFPKRNKFSRQDKYQVVLHEGHELTVTLSASVVIDHTKPDSFFVLGEKLGKGGISRVKHAFYYRDGELVENELQKIIALPEGKAAGEHRYIAKRASDNLKIVDGDDYGKLIVRHDDKKLYISMRKREGKECFEYGAELDVLSFSDYLAIMRAVHDALVRLHRDHGLIHCDVKPENILFDKKNGEWHAELVDFDFSTRVGASTRKYGTSEYMHIDLFIAPDRKAGNWIDAHGFAGFIGILICDGFMSGKDRIRERTQDEYKVVHARYKFTSATFIEQVLIEYHDALICLLKHLEGREFKTPTDDQITACLEMLAVHHDHTARGIRCDADRLARLRTALTTDEMPIPLAEVFQPLYQITPQPVLPVPRTARPRLHASGDSRSQLLPMRVESEEVKESGCESIIDCFASLFSCFKPATPPVEVAFASNASTSPAGAAYE